MKVSIPLQKDLVPRVSGLLRDRYEIASKGQAEAKVVGKLAAIQTG
jgi:hypothetical protein